MNIKLLLYIDEKNHLNIGRLTLEMIQNFDLDQNIWINRWTPPPNIPIE